MNEAEWDMKNYADRGGSCPRRLKAEVDNTLRDLHNSSCFFGQPITMSSNERKQSPDYFDAVLNLDLLTSL